MTPQDFCYWLKGYVELAETTSLTDNQVLVIKDHLDLVFKKVTPDRTEKATKVNEDQETRTEFLKRITDLKQPISPNIWPGQYPYNPYQPVQPFQPFVPTWPTITC